MSNSPADDRADEDRTYEDRAYQDGAYQESGPAKAPVAALVAPVLAFGATFVAKKALTGMYRSTTGREAPSGQDRTASLGSVLAWAAVTAATSAIIEVAIFRATARVLDDQRRG